MVLLPVNFLYTSLTPKRSTDGLTLIMSSSDGFCSTLSFAPGELGQPYTGPISASHPASSAASSQPTLSHASSPVKASHAASTTNAPPTATQPPPASPARSNSVCSVATQSSTQQSSGVVNNPTPTFGAVPLVTATNSSQPPTLPLSTPPQTPMSTVSQSGSSGILGKRDTRPASESEREETKPPDSQQKKRRVAPTLVSAGDSSSSRDDSNKTDPGS